MIIGIVIAAQLVLGILFLLQHEAFTSRESKKEIISETWILYQELQFDIRIFSQFLEELIKKLDPKYTPKNSRFISIFADHFSGQEEPHLARNLIGVMLDDVKDMDSLKKYAKENNLGLAKLSRFEANVSTQRYVTSFSFKFLTFSEKAVFEASTPKKSGSRKKMSKGVFGYIVDRRGLGGQKEVIKVWMPANLNFTGFNKLFSLKRGHRAPESSEEVKKEK